MYVAEKREVEIYPSINAFQSHGKFINGKKVVIIDYDIIEGIHPKTDRVYKAISFEFLQYLMGSKDIIRALAEEKKIGFCFFEEGSLKVLGMHPFINQILLDNGIIEVLLKDGEDKYLIENEFAPQILDEEEYENLVVEAEKFMIQHNHSISSLSKFIFKDDTPLNGTFPFYIEGESGIGSEEDPKIYLALNLCLLNPTKESKKTKKLISDKKIVFVRFEQGICSNLTFHKDKYDYAKEFTKIIIQVDECKVLLTELPHFEEMSPKLYSLNAKQLTSNKQTQGRCILS